MVISITPKEKTPANLSKLLAGSGSFALSPEYLNLDSELKKEASLLNNHIWLSSSGSYQKKLIALSREALMASANSVNAWLQSSREDHWVIALPLDHIGGLSIVARSLLAGFKISHFQENWNPYKFCSFMGREKISLASLVPTQLFDMVGKELEPPPGLRAVVIGGARLDADLYSKARRLGWPVLPSYGLTECCSQVASASLASLNNHTDYPALFVLPHLSCRLNEDRILEISGNSLLSACIDLQESQTQKLIKIEAGQFFRTNDVAELHHYDNTTEIKLLGRADRQIKIRGWLVSLDQVESKVREFLSSKSLQLLSAIGSRTSSRDGAELVLHVSAGSPASNLLNELNSYLSIEDLHLPQICEIIEHKQFPLLDNGKINYRALNTQELQ